MSTPSQATTAPSFSAPAPAGPGLVTAGSGHPSAQALASATIKEVFLSPRVIDREAFNDYSTSLRRYIEEAANQSETLKHASEAAHQAQQSLMQTAARHQGRFDGAHKALSQIESKLEQADKLMHAATDAQQRLDVARLAALDELQAKQRDLLTSLEKAASETEARIRRAEQQCTQAIMELVGSAERKLAQVEAKIIEFKPRSTPAPVPAPVMQAAQVVQAPAQAIVAAIVPPPLPMSAPVSGPLPTLDTSKAFALKAELEAVVARAAETLALAKSRSTDLSSLTDQAALAKSVLMAAINEAAGRIDELLDRAESVRETAAAVGPACERAEARVGHTLAQIEAASDQARSVVVDTQSIISRLATLMEQLQPWAPMLMADEDGQVPPMLQRAVELARQQIAREASEIARALTDASSRVASLSRA